ncbi:MAG: HD domain-containing protein [Armatimonadetes bacterium]|nr:HD domain-containing protein [Armatimonadota bacterium]
MTTDDRGVVDLYDSFNDTVRALVQALDLHEPGEGGHSERVSVYATAMGQELGMTFDDLLDLRRAAALHDIGKISVSQATLRKLGDLEEGELEELRSHALMALKIVGSFEWLRPTVPMIQHHHERWDGSGYPDGLAGEDIPLGARIIGVAEAFDVLVTGSPWRRHVTDPEALEELQRCSGAQFDPQVVDALVKVQPLIQPVGRS